MRTMQRSRNFPVFLSGMLLSQTLVIFMSLSSFITHWPWLLAYVILQDLPFAPQSDFVKW